MIKILKKIFSSKEKCKYRWNASNNYLYLTKEMGDVSYSYVINKDGDIVGKSQSKVRKVDTGLRKI